jgi:hypothetical protein
MLRHQYWLMRTMRHQDSKNEIIEILNVYVIQQNEQADCFAEAHKMIALLLMIFLVLGVAGEIM